MKMGISEQKMQIVIDNYFKTECDINTSIRSAFEKGFRLGVKKQPKIIRCKGCKYYNDHTEECYNDNGLRFLDYSNLDEMYCAWAERREE